MRPGCVYEYRHVQAPQNRELMFIISSARTYKQHEEHRVFALRLNSCGATELVTWFMWPDNWIEARR